MDDKFSATIRANRCSAPDPFGRAEGVPREEQVSGTEDGFRAV